MQRNSILQIWRTTTGSMTNLIPPTLLSVYSSLPSTALAFSSSSSSSPPSTTTSSFRSNPLRSSSFLLYNRSSRAYLHTTTSLYRGSKNLDWYRNALRRIEQEKNRINPPVFPTETLHGKPRQRIALEFQIGKDTDNNIQRIIIELADDIVPLTVSNFVKLCQNPVGEGYKGSEIFRIQKNFALFMGDYKLNNGHGSTSSFSHTFFPDENFIGRHTRPGVLGMANSGVHTNGSVFYITTTPATHLDGRNVVFGRIIDGMDVLKKLESVLTVNLKPATPITIKQVTEIVPNSKEWLTIDNKLKSMESTNSNSKGTSAPAVGKSTVPTDKKGVAPNPASAKTTEKKPKS